LALGGLEAMKQESVDLMLRNNGKKEKGHMD
jgi:hypothetical protein